MKLHAPSAHRNREPILDVLRPRLARGAFVVEIASGSGEHAVFLARELPHVTWQPTDTDAAALASIEAHRAEANLPNLLAPVGLDASRDAWPIARADAIVCINMLHISPWRAAVGLFRGAARTLSNDGALFTYGPYRFSGAFTAESNREFDASLRARDPAWGVRDVDDLDALAGELGLARAETIAMPANNHVLVYLPRS